ncbi:acetate--CoA ligase family protein [Natrinema gelatinilyticum]|uniref:acetate--CoA ligase family protein n=1 Tax=Natrinema gelatinilyticum TaxID=2961571 RepID=UPI0020C21A0C|nr:acetate--CoA ligase family protein [Natrinema gelatinilyticum]
MASRDQSSDRIGRILDPQSIAIAGASADESKRGYIATKRLEESDYDGDVYPVNPSYEGEILGKEVYPSVSAIPDRVDLVYVVTPAGAVPEILEDAGGADAAGAVIFSAGFSEVGNEETEDELVRIAEEHGIRFFGPNVMGMVNVPEDVYLGIDASYSPGGLSMVSQSGNLGMYLGVVANAERNTGLSHFVSIGNEADLKFHELLPYFASDDETDVLVLYVEGMSEGRAFLKEAARFSQEKPLIVLKGGRTGAGKSSAASHTASLAGDATVLEDVYSQAGIVTVDSFDDIVPVGQALTGQPALSGRNIAVMTEAGGVATTSADSLVEHGLTVPELTEETQDKLAELFPYSPNLENPIDTMVSGETASVHDDAAEILLSDPNIDGLLICGSYGGYGVGGTGIELPTDEASAKAQIESARRIARLPAEYDKPVIVNSAFTPEESEALAICRDAGVPVYDSFRDASLAFQALADYSEFLETADERSDFATDSDDGGHEAIQEASEGVVLTEDEAKGVLEDYDIPVASYRLVTSAEDAVRAASEFDGDVAMKIVSPQIQHKTEAGGVSLGVSGVEDVRATYEELLANAEAYDPGATIDGVLVSPMLEEGVEVIIGATQDEEVGPVVMFGLGGIFVEVLEDVTFGAVPLTERDARRMIEQIDGKELLEGARDRLDVDVDALVNLLVAVSRLVAENQEITELDLNPVFCYEDGVSVVDAGISL